MADIYTLDEFSAFMQSSAIDEEAAILLRELVTGLVDDIDPFVDGYPVRVKALALTAAARAYANPQGYTSETVGTYSYRRNAESGVYFTDAERALVAAAVPGVSRSASYTVSMAGSTAATLPPWADWLWADV